MSLPAHRRAVMGRTFGSPWDAGTTGPGAAIERRLPRTGQRTRDVSFGFAMACVVALVVYAIARGWVFGAMQ